MEATRRAMRDARTFGLQARVAALESENARLMAGLRIIIENGEQYGTGWCIAQARGYLYDLDFDSYPETGRPPK